MCRPCSLPGALVGLTFHAMQPLNFFLPPDRSALASAKPMAAEVLYRDGPKLDSATRLPRLLWAALFALLLLGLLAVLWLGGASTLSMLAAAGLVVAGLALLSLGVAGGLVLHPVLHTWLARWGQPASAALELDVVLDGNLRPSVLHAALGAAMVEAWSLGATLGDKPPVFRLHRLVGAGVAYKIVAQIDSRQPAPGPARHTLLGCVHKHLRFANLRPVLPGRSGMAETEQRPRDLQRPDEQLFAVDQVDLFAVLSPFERRMLVSALHVKHLPAGAVAVHSGEAGQSMFVVASGVLQVEAERADAQPTVLGPGQVFGEMSMLTGAPRNATVRSLFAAVLFEVPHTVLAELLVQRPELVDDLAQVISQQRACVPGPQEPALDAAAPAVSQALAEPAENLQPDAATTTAATTAATTASKIAAEMRQFFAALPRPT